MFDESLYEVVNTNFYKRKSDGVPFIRTSKLVAVKDSGNKLIHYYKEVPGVDIASFKKLPFSGFYCTDKSNVYTWDAGPNGEEIEVLKGADPKTFESIAYMWGKDSLKVFYGKNVLPGLDPAQLAVVCGETNDSTSKYIEYIRDNDQLFYRDTQVKVPEGIDITQLTCKLDLMGNPFLAIGEQLYIIRNGKMEEYP